MGVHAAVIGIRYEAVFGEPALHFLEAFKLGELHQHLTGRQVDGLAAGNVHHHVRRRSRQNRLRQRDLHQLDVHAYAMLQREVAVDLLLEDFRLLTAAVEPHLDLLRGGAVRRAADGNVVIGKGAKEGLDLENQGLPEAGLRLADRVILSHHHNVIDW